jgi:hypothetical protein
VRGSNAFAPAAQCTSTALAPYTVPVANLP